MQRADIGRFFQAQQHKMIIRTNTGGAAHRKRFRLFAQACDQITKATQWRIGKHPKPAGVIYDIGDIAEFLGLPAHRAFQR